MFPVGAVLAAAHIFSPQFCVLLLASSSEPCYIWYGIHSARLTIWVLLNFWVWLLASPWEPYRIWYFAFILLGWRISVVSCQRQSHVDSPWFWLKFVKATSKLWMDFKVSFSVAFGYSTFHLNRSRMLTPGHCSLTLGAVWARCLYSREAATELKCARIFKTRAPRAVWSVKQHAGWIHVVNSRSDQLHV